MSPRPTARSGRSPRRLVTSAVAAAAVAVLALTGCAASGAGADVPAGDPVDGGTLSVAIGNDPISLNPSANGSGNDTWYVTRQLVDSLLYQNPTTGALDPWLATSYEARDDATSFTFHLRDDVTFSDGTAFTAAAVKGTFDDIVAAGAKAAGATVSALVGYEESRVVDDHTVEVVFSTPNAAFPSSTTTVGLGIVGAATREVPFEGRADGAAVVGTGPFTLASYTPDVSTELAKRADYAWGPEALGNAGAAHLDGVSFQVVPEASVRTGSLTSDQVDVAGGIQPLDVATLDASGYGTVTRGNPGLLFNVSFNVERPAVSDPAVREAIARAIDATEIRDTSLTDAFAVGDSVLSSTTPGYASQSDVYGFDAAAAATLLDGAGWTTGADGIRVKDGQRLSLTLIWITNFGPNQTSLEVLQRQLQAAGIEIVLQGGAVPEFQEIRAAGEFDLAWANLSRADGDVLRTTYSSAGTNEYNIQDPELESLLTQQLATSDQAERDAVLAEVQARIASQYYAVPVHELTTIIGVGPSVQGVGLGADARLDSLVGAWKTA